METTFPQVAGRIAGRIAGTATRYVNQINWAEVMETFLHGLKVMIAITLVLARYSRQAWDNLPAWSEKVGKAYSSLIVGHVTKSVGVTAVKAPPAQHPLQEIADDLQSMTCSQLRALVGTKRKLTKAQLIAMAVAC